MVFGSGLGLVLSLVFGCLLLALVAELYYLLWWKKLRINSDNSCTIAQSDFSKPCAAGNADEASDMALVEAELMRIQNRLLFTIKEETKEDLESEDGRSKARSLSDLVLDLDSSMADEEKRRCSSSPPKMRFLREAEEKMYRRVTEEARKVSNGGFQRSVAEEEEDWRNGSFIRIIVGKNISDKRHSSSTQVIPMPGSVEKKSNSDQ